jgi:NADH-quinone oxidoreductase subunit E
METKTNKTFTPDFRAKADAILSNYEQKRASILMILRLIQDEYGHITRDAELETAEYLGIAPIDVREVMTFYTLFYDKPKAKNRFNVCRTLACALYGAEDIVKHLEQKLGIKAGQTSADGNYSIQKVECLGACEIAPMLQFNDDAFHGCLTKEKVDALLKQTEVASSLRSSQ